MKHRSDLEAARREIAVHQSLFVSYLCSYQLISGDNGMRIFSPSNATLRGRVFLQSNLRFHRYVQARSATRDGSSGSFSSEGFSARPQIRFSVLSMRISVLATRSPVPHFWNCIHYLLVSMYTCISFNFIGGRMYTSSGIAVAVQSLDHLAIESGRRAVLSRRTVTSGRGAIPRHRVPSV